MSEIRNLNKKDLARALAETHNITIKEAREIVDEIFGIMSDALAAGDEITITGFGKFSVSTRAPRVGINPITKETIDIESVRTPKFKASRTLKGLVG